MGAVELFDQDVMVEQGVEDRAGPARGGAGEDEVGLAWVGREAVEGGQGIEQPGALGADGAGLLSSTARWRSAKTPLAWVSTLML